MKKRMIIIAVIILSLYFIGRKFIISSFENNAFVLLKKNAGMVYPDVHKDIDIKNGDKILKARWVSAGETEPAFFILHGNGENLGDWIKVQQYLQRKGFSSFVFDYSGFGNSTGKPTIEGIEEDAVEAYKEYIKLSALAGQRILFTHSMGGSVFLDIPGKFIPRPDKYVINAPISSAKDYLVENQMISKNLSWIVPDLWDNTKSLKNLDDTIYLLLGSSDEVINKSMRDKLVAAAQPHTHVFIQQDFQHNTMLENPCDSTWRSTFKILQ